MAIGFLLAPLFAFAACLPPDDAVRDVELDVRTPYGDRISDYEVGRIWRQPDRTLVEGDSPKGTRKLRLAPGFYRIELRNVRSPRYQSSWGSVLNVELNCRASAILYLTSPSAQFVLDGFAKRLPTIEGSIKGANREGPLWIQLVRLYQPGPRDTLAPVAPHGRFVLEGLFQEGKYMLVVLAGTRVLKMQDLVLGQDPPLRTTVVIDLPPVQEHSRQK